MKPILTISIMLIAAFTLHAQKKNVNEFVDLSATIGNSQGALSFSYVHNWKIVKLKKWEIGIGGRISSYIGTKTDFTTVPARLARPTTFPFIIVFAGQEAQNWDTLTVQRPFATSVNVSANFGYNFGKKWYGGFNIDLLGFTFGREGSAILTSNGTTRNEPAAKPSAFNVLLTGDNDYGTLNSEFFVKYKLTERWQLKAVYQFLFVEYETRDITQTAPDGTIVDRFRNKANLLGAGISYHF